MKKLPTKSNQKNNDEKKVTINFDLNYHIPEHPFLFQFEMYKYQYTKFKKDIELITKLFKGFIIPHPDGKSQQSIENINHAIKTELLYKEEDYFKISTTSRGFARVEFILQGKVNRSFLRSIQALRNNYINHRVTPE